MLGHREDPFLMSLKTSILFSIGAGPASIPTSSVWGFFSSISLWTLGLYEVDNSQRCEIVSPCGLDLYFTDDNDGGRIFLCLLAICMSSLEKCLFSILPIFIAFFLLSGMNSFLFWSSVLVRCANMCKYIYLIYKYLNIYVKIFSPIQ